MNKIHKKIEQKFGDLASYVYNHKYIALISVILITVILVSQFTKLKVDMRDEGFFHDDDPFLIEYNNFNSQRFLVSFLPIIHVNYYGNAKKNL